LHIEEGHDAFWEDWIWLGAEKAADLNSYMSVDSALATCGVYGVGELCIDHTDGRSSEKYLIFDIFVNCNWVVTRWQQYSTHLHTNNT
jgi:hypothetical protein